MTEKIESERAGLDGVKAAKLLSDEAIEDAKREYYEKGEILFSSGMRNDKQYGEEVLERIEKVTENIKKGAEVPLSPFSDDDFYAIRCALTLPAALHYNEFEYVGTGGDYDNGQFKRQEEWSSCEFTDLRKRIVGAIADLNLQDAIQARKFFSSGAKDAFSRAHATVVRECIMSEVTEASLTKKSADDVIGLIMTGIESLWNEFQINENLKSVQGSNAEDDDCVKIVPGKYGSTVISNIDNEKRIITFVGERGRKGDSFKIPCRAEFLWLFLKMLIETKSKDGSTEIPERLNRWEGLFSRKKKGAEKELKKLRRHIVSCKGVGERGPKVLKIVAKAQPKKDAIFSIL
jgi:hypothetical protein